MEISDADLCSPLSKYQPPVRGSARSVNLSTASGVQIENACRYMLTSVHAQSCLQNQGLHLDRGRSRIRIWGERVFFQGVAAEPGRKQD